jgi:hypothetical protein
LADGIAHQFLTGLPALVRRLRCYANGDFAGAATISNDLVDLEGEIGWLNSGDEDTTAEYALAAALRSCAQAETAVAGLHTKAEALVGITLAASAGALVAGNASLRVAHNPGFLRWVSFGLWAAVVLVLLISALYAFLATSTHYGGGLNIARLKCHGTIDSGYKRHEALVWHRNALRAMEAAARLGSDIFTSRRWLLCALILAILATVATVLRTA